MAPLMTPLARRLAEIEALYKQADHPPWWDAEHSLVAAIPWLVARLRAAMAVVEKSRPVALRGHTPELGYAIVAFDALAGEET